MNHQELLNTVTDSELDTSLLPFIKNVRFCDVTIPRFFSGWPYYILILATLLMGSTKVSSQGLKETESPWAPIQHVITGLDSISRRQYFGRVGELQSENRCVIHPKNQRALASEELSNSAWCSKGSSPNQTF